MTSDPLGAVLGEGLGTAVGPEVGEKVGDALILAPASLVSVTSSKPGIASPSANDGLPRTVATLRWFAEMDAGKSNRGSSSSL